MIKLSDSCDPVCLIHGKKLSEHVCLYCCMCFKPLEPKECTPLPNGRHEDVCIDCAKDEVKNLFFECAKILNVCVELHSYDERMKYSDYDRARKLLDILKNKGFKL